MTDHSAGRSGVNLRALALEILLEVNEKGQYSNRVLKDVLDKYQYLEKRDRAFLTRLADGTLEQQIRLDDIIGRFSRVPVKKLKPVIREILRLGVYQLLFMDSVPASAVCNESVKLAEKKGFRGLKGFVNGVLRNISREIPKTDALSVESDFVKALSVAYSMPEWIVAKWLGVYSADTVKKMLASFLEARPLTVRCRKTGKASVEECIRSLEKEGVRVNVHPYLPYCLQLTGVDRPEALTAFLEGRITVQDVSSMLAGEIAAPRKGDLVLDVCAAPGGKSLHVADLLEGTGTVYARDLYEEKTDRIEENRKRLGAENLVIQKWDARVFDQQFQEKADILLADLPCSGLGVIGKKKDIKYRMTEEQQAELIRLQKQILDVVWRYVKPGGVLIYSTCTVNRGENEDMVSWFTERYPFQTESLEPYLCEELQAEPSVPEGYLQLLPGIHACDGFFMARLRRKVNDCE